MAWSILRKNVPGKIPTFRSLVCDTEDDVLTLPTDVAFGSEAFCIENGKTYILETDGDWVEKTSSGGGGETITVEPLSVVENEITTAPEGTAYNPVTVNVPSAGGDGFYISANSESGSTQVPSGKVLHSTTKDDDTNAFTYILRIYAYATNEMEDSITFNGEGDVSGQEIYATSGTTNDTITFSIDTIDEESSVALSSWYDMTGYSYLENFTNYTWTITMLSL